MEFLKKHNGAVPHFDYHYSMHAEQRKRVLDSLKDLQGQKAAILLRGGRQKARHNTDNDWLFRQESFFYYLFGVNEPDLYGAIDLQNKQALLFVPRLDESYEVWCGKRKPLEHYRDKYGVDHVFFTDQLEQVLTERQAQTLYVLKGKNTDSGNEIKPAKFPGVEKFQLNTDRLHPALVECRVHKTAEEVRLLKHVCEVSSLAHTSLMSVAKPGMWEYQAESHWLHLTYLHGNCRFQAYPAIFGSGPNSAILHYGHSACPHMRQMQQGEFLLIDAGAELFCYASDITRTIPIGGKFSANQRVVYEAVLQAQLAVIGAAKPGVHWMDMHMLANRTIVAGLLKAGLLKGSLEELVKNEIGDIFFPHGLGHLMGLEVHDVGGILPGQQKKRLRLHRILEPGMVITVEPGCYFIDALLDAALANPQKAKFLVPERVQEFRGIGGVRIEDDILVTQHGCELLTHVPKTVEEIEKIMAEAQAAAPGK